MGKVFSSLIKRPLRNWNVDNRAQRLIDNNAVKTTIAPKHKSTERLIEEFSREHPEILQEQHTKDDLLLSRLKGASVNPERFREIQPTRRPLPENRFKVVQPDYGVQTPIEVPAGRYTLPQAIDFLNAHHSDPKGYPVEAVAAGNKLDLRHTRAVLKYFHVLHMQMPMTSAGHKLLVESSVYDKKGSKQTQQSELKSGGDTNTS